MTLFEAKPAAEILAQRRLGAIKGPRLVESLRPTTLDQGFAVQQQVVAHYLTEHADRVAGWKCLLPSEGKWVVAPIFSSTVFDGSIRAKLWPTKGVARIEPELAFELAADLPPRSAAYSHLEIDESIKSVRMALELIDCRFAEPSVCDFPELLADGLFNQGLVVGPEVDRDLAYAAASLNIFLGFSEQVAGEGDDGHYHDRHYDGKHQNLDPVAPLYWLVNFLRDKGVTLHRGQYVITGSYAGVIDVPLDRLVHLRYEGLGEMSTYFAPW